ncbi:hypothetical protein CY35_04G107700 [Sphagnum magellanicum]|nr:hypothetical protein CY35_04G107700 [Sphagnum magellanicum]
MAEARWPPDDGEQQPQAPAGRGGGGGGGGAAEGNRQGDVDVTTHYSDDERSVAADSWSVKSEYGSTLDGEDQRTADVVDALNAAAAFRPSEYLSDKDEHDSEMEASVLGLQSHWDSTYADELANFHEHGDAGEIWFGEEVMETVAAWTARICVAVAAGLPWDPVDGFAMAPRGLCEMSSGGSMALELANWNVLDLGTGNGLFLHALFKQGFTDLTGTDYSQGAVELAGAVAERSNVDNITFLVDDVLDSKLNRQFQLVTDKGTLDAIGLHSDGVAHRFQYWKALCKLVAPGGVLVITSCNSTKDELVAEVNAVSQSWKVNEHGAKEDKDTTSHCSLSTRLTFEYIDHIRTYPTFRFGGIEGSRVSTVAFLLKA